MKSPAKKGPLTGGGGLFPQVGRKVKQLLPYSGKVHGIVLYVKITAHFDDVSRHRGGKNLYLGKVLLELGY